MSVAYFLLCYVHYGVGRIGKPAEFYNSVFRFRNMETSDTSFSVPCVCIKREREGGKKERERKKCPSEQRCRCSFRVYADTRQKANKSGVF